MKRIKSFIQKETVLCIAALCALATVALVPPDREYLHYIDWRVLCLNHTQKQKEHITIFPE